MEFSMLTRQEERNAEKERLEDEMSKRANVYNVAMERPVDKKRERLVIKLKKILSKRYTIEDKEYILLVDRFNLDEEGITRETISNLLNYLDMLSQYSDTSGSTPIESLRDSIVESENNVPEYAPRFRTTSNLETAAFNENAFVENNIEQDEIDMVNTIPDSMDPIKFAKAQVRPDLEKLLMIEIDTNNENIMEIPVNANGKTISGFQVKIPNYGFYQNPKSIEIHNVFVSKDSASVSSNEGNYNLYIENALAGGSFILKFSNGGETNPIFYPNGFDTKILTDAINSINNINVIGITGSGTSADPFQIKYDSGQTSVGLSVDFSNIVEQSPPSISITTHTEGGISYHQSVITLENITSGAYTLTYSSTDTSGIEFNATAEEIKDALNSIDADSIKNVIGDRGGPYTITFSNQTINTLSWNNITDSLISTIPLASVQNDLVTKGQYVPHQQLIKRSAQINGGTFIMTLNNQQMTPLDWNSSSGDIYSELKKVNENIIVDVCGANGFTIKYPDQLSSYNLSIDNDNLLTISGDDSIVVEQLTAGVKVEQIEKVTIIPIITLSGSFSVSGQSYLNWDVSAGLLETELGPSIVSKVTGGEGTYQLVRTFDKSNPSPALLNVSENDSDVTIELVEKGIFKEHQQNLKFNNCSGGSFTLTLNNQTTQDISFDVSKSVHISGTEIQTELQKFNKGIEVTMSDPSGKEFVVNYTEPLENYNLIANKDNIIALNGGIGDVSISVSGIQEGIKIEQVEKITIVPTSIGSGLFDLGNATTLMYDISAGLLELKLGNLVSNVTGGDGVFTITRDFNPSAPNPSLLDISGLNGKVELITKGDFEKEIQLLKKSQDIDGGSFTLNLNGQETTNLIHNIAASELQVQLKNINNNIYVTASGSNNYIVSYSGHMDAYNLTTDVTNIETIKRDNTFVVETKQTGVYQRQIEKVSISNTSSGAFLLSNKTIGYNDTAESVESILSASGEADHVAGGNGVYTITRPLSASAIPLLNISGESGLISTYPMEVNINVIGTYDEASETQRVTIVNKSNIIVGTNTFTLILDGNSTDLIDLSTTNNTDIAAKIKAAFVGNVVNNVSLHSTDVYDIVFNGSGGNINTITEINNFVSAAPLSMELVNNGTSTGVLSKVGTLIFMRIEEFENNIEDHINDNEYYSYITKTYNNNIKIGSKGKFYPQEEFSIEKLTMSFYTLDGNNADKRNLSGVKFIFKFMY